MKGAPRSKVFDDVYFSAVDGLEETHYVFLQGNGLPGAWAGRADFTIAETGFGTGLNFLAVAALLREAPGPKLHYISFEKYPVAVEEIANALAVWREEFPAELDRLLEVYPAQDSGVHRIEFSERITLTLIFDDVNEAMPKLNAEVDCWFLDGFKPRKNPDMWTEIVFQNMARLSKPNASYATFTAAGFVKRGLKAAGFDVKRIKGFGNKWHMIVGLKT
jgi:tRNA 5-methylaminomethyl-2-thiouridine biosynthesis bifunctional protein